MNILVCGGNDKLIIKLIDELLDNSDKRLLNTITIIDDQSTIQPYRENVLESFAYLNDDIVHYYNSCICLKTLEQLHRIHNFTHIINNIRYNPVKSYEKNTASLVNEYTELIQFISNKSIQLLNLRRIFTHKTFMFNYKSDVIEINHSFISIQKEIEKLYNINNKLNINELHFFDYIIYDDRNFSNYLIDEIIKQFKTNCPVYAQDENIHMTHYSFIVSKIISFLKFSKGSDYNIIHGTIVNIKTQLIPCIVHFMNIYSKISSTSRQDKLRYILVNKSGNREQVYEGTGYMLDDCLIDNIVEISVKKIFEIYK